MRFRTAASSGSFDQEALVSHALVGHDRLIADHAALLLDRLLLLSRVPHVEDEPLPGGKPGGDTVSRPLFVNRREDPHGRAPGAALASTRCLADQHAGQARGMRILAGNGMRAGTE
jgi:hypothetical protein